MRFPWSETYKTAHTAIFFFYLSPHLSLSEMSNGANYFTIRNCWKDECFTSTTDVVTQFKRKIHRELLAAVILWQQLSLFHLVCYFFLLSHESNAFFVCLVCAKNHFVVCSSFLFIVASTNGGNGLFVCD